MLDQQFELDALWDAIKALDVDVHPDHMTAGELTRLAVELDRATVYMAAVAGRVLQEAEQAYVTEVAALKDALARAAQPTPASDEEDEAWVETARGLPDA